MEPNSKSKKLRSKFDLKFQSNSGNHQASQDGRANSGGKFHSSRNINLEQTQNTAKVKESNNDIEIGFGKNQIPTPNLIMEESIRPLNDSTETDADQELSAQKLPDESVDHRNFLSNFLKNPLQHILNTISAGVPSSSKMGNSSQPLDIGLGFG